jgi:hypothetical protein
MQQQLLHNRKPGRKQEAWRRQQLLEEQRRATEQLKKNREAEALSAATARAAQSKALQANRALMLTTQFSLGHQQAENGQEETKEEVHPFSVPVPGDEEQHSDSDTQEKKLKEDELIGPDEEKNGKGAESQGSFEQKLKNASEDANGRTYTIATPRRADNGSLSSQTANNNIEMLLSVSVERSLVESLSQQHAMVHNLTW